jgi:hypothetical protein
MGMHIDEAGGHDTPFGVDGAPGPFTDLAHLDNSITADPHVDPPWRRPRPVDHLATADHEIKHLRLLFQRD